MTNAVIVSTQNHGTEPIFVGLPEFDASAEITLPRHDNDCVQEATIQSGAIIRLRGMGGGGS
jgi:hypothetical protein